MLDLHLLAELGGRLPAWALDMTLWTGGALLLAAVADRLLRRRVSPGLRVLLYSAVFVRAALPADWVAPLSLAPAAAAVAPVTDGWAASTLVAPTPGPLLSLGEAAAAPAPVVAAEARASSAGYLLFGAYALGAALLLGAAAWNRRRLAVTLRRATPARRRVADLAPGTCVLEDMSIGPLAFGVVRPALVLPRALVDALDDAELACVVAHERAHLRRRDPLLATALSTATALLWPLLPVWLAAARIRQLVEQAADALAVADNRARVYGETLLKLASRPAPRLPLAVGVQLGRFDDLRDRLLALRVRPRWPRALQGALVVAVAGVGLACSGRAGEPEDCPDPQTLRCDELRQISAAEHNRYEMTLDPQAHAAAMQAYDEFAGACAAHPDHEELLHYRGELQWSLAVAKAHQGDAVGARDAYRRAHEAFMRALAGGPGRLTREAARGQMLAKRNELGVDVDAPPVAAPSTPGAPFVPSEYTADEQALLASYDVYQRHLGAAVGLDAGRLDEGEVAGLQEVLVHSARLAMRHNRFGEAEVAARMALGGATHSRLALAAAEILTDVLTIRWTGADKSADPAAGTALAAWLEQVARLPLYQLEEAARLREATTALRAGVAWREAMAEQAAGHHRPCGERFDAIAAEFPAHPQLAAVRWNAAQCWSAAGERELAVERARAVLELDPDGKFAAQARAMLKSAR